MYVGTKQYLIQNCVSNISSYITYAQVDVAPTRGGGEGDYAFIGQPDGDLVS